MREVIYGKDVAPGGTCTVQIRYAPRGINVDGPKLFASEAEADAWIAAHKKQNDVPNDPYLRSAIRNRKFWPRS
jgi:hypothetical protein